MFSITETHLNTTSEMEDLGLVEFFTALLNLPDFYSMGIEASYTLREHSSFFKASDRQLKC